MSRVHLSRFAVVLLVGFDAATALAQPAAPRETSAPAVPVMPPHLQGTADVAYPEGASGEAHVVLELLISVGGIVDDVKRVEGDEPFIGAAVLAARTWHFDPATRDGKPVAARIRFEVRFRPPEPEPAPIEAPAAGKDDAKQDVPPAPSAEEVNVRGNRAPPGATSIGRAEVRQLPGAFGDPFRAIDALPGVTPIVSGLPFFYVRGAPPGNVGYFLDGVKVPYLFHVGAGPSVLHPGMIDRVDLYPGGYPARYGRFSGSVVAAETLVPRPAPHGEANVRLFDLGALAETGFDNGRGSALVAGRYSYTAAILSLIAKDSTLDYRDYEARVSYDVTPKDRVSLLTFGSFDLLSQTVDGIENVLFASEFYRADLRYDRTIDTNTRIRTAVTLGFDQTRIPNQPRNSQNKMVSARVEASHAPSNRVLLRAGADVTVERYTSDEQPYADPDDPDTQRFNGLFPARDDTTIGGWTDVVLKLRGWEVTPGVRFDIYNSGGATSVAVDPRLSSRIDVVSRVHILHTFGIAHQAPSYVIPIPGLAIGTLRGGLQRSLQASAGVEVDLPEATTATVTLFDNVFQNMSDTLGVTPSRNPDENFNRDDRSLGSAMGVEAYVRRKLTRRVGGYISYTFSRSTREVGRERFISAFDRPHVANAALAFDLGRNWRAGTRFTVYSGTPILPPANNGLIPPQRSLDPERDPAFYRLDLRIEKRWNLSEKAWIAFVAEVMNATLHQEIVLGQTIGPVTIPSIGVEGAFN